MTELEQSAILTIGLMAAFADGAKDERERAQIRSIAESLSGGGSSVNLVALYQDVLLKRVSPATVVQALQSDGTRQLAYEMAVCVCDADGAHNAAEQAFLNELRGLLGLDARAARDYASTADAVASVPLDAPATGPVAAATPATGAGPEPMILNYSILSAALELLPQSLATMAIIPLQMKMVYRIGKSHGYELDRGHIKDLLATMGVGMTSQYVEEIGRKLLGGLLKSVGGGLAGALGRQATGSAMAFATTYALGHVAQRYYATGRSLRMDTLKEAYAAMLGQARDLRGRYAGEIEAKARTIDVSRLPELLRQL